MKILLFAFLISFTFPFNLNSQAINEIIPVLNLPAGEKKTFLISDLFYSGNEYMVVFNPDSSLNVFYEPENRLLEISSAKDYEAYTVFPFSYYNKTYHILCKTEFQQTISFSYKPGMPVKKINLFGNFNGWNRENLPLTDADGDGIYSIGVKLEPGRYEYKFFIQPADKRGNEEVIDPTNPDSIPNGLGGWNSVVVVKPLHTGKVYVHLLDYSYQKNNSVFSFYYESDKESLFEVIALLDNEYITDTKIVKDGRKIEIELPSEKLKGNKTLRVAVNDNGRASNLQTIMLKDGKPLSNNDTTWYDAIIYSIMVDRFNDGDSTNSIPVEHPEILKPANYQGGDLQGIIDKLEEGYFTELGINTLWISPVIDNTPNAYKEYPSPHRYYTGYHGYWPVHPARVEERFGDMDLLKKMIRIAHSKGIKVLLDFVANHIHIEHPFWKENREWFGVLELPDGSLNLRLWDEQRLTTWFEPFMPSFDFEGSYEALEVMTDNAVWWLKETGADGFRHDAVKHIPNEFWRMLTRKIKKELEISQKKIYYQIGETFGSYDLVSSYVNNGQLSAQFNFNLYDTAIPAFILDEVPFTALEEQVQKTHSVYGVNHLMGNVMDSHDKVRFMAYADGDVLLSDGNAIEIGWNNPPEVDDPLSYNKLKLYLAYMMTIPGLPVIYYGSEIGMTGAGDPDNRRMMRFGNDLTEDETKVLEEVKKIIHSRNSHPALRYGDFQTLLVNESCYAYLRSDFNERILTVLSKSDNEEKIIIPLPYSYNLSIAEDLISGRVFNIKDNEFQLYIDATDFMILKLE